MTLLLLWKFSSHLIRAHSNKGSTAGCVVQGAAKLNSTSSNIPAACCSRVSLSACTRLSYYCTIYELTLLLSFNSRLEHRNGTHCMLSQC